MNVLQKIEQAELALRLGEKVIPEFAPGDVVRVQVKVTDGNRTRLQAFEGVCIARRGGGLHESFVVRKLSFGEGVERTFPLTGPTVDSITVVRRGRVRRAKLYYLRERTGKSARIAERIDRRVRVKGPAVAVVATPEAGAEA